MPLGVNWALQGTSGRRSARRLLALAAAAALPFAGPLSAQAGASVLSNPSANVPRTPAMQSACEAGPGQVCQAAAVEAIDAARAAEGVGPLVLPTYYGTLNVPEQLLVLADLERVDRGLPGFEGLSHELDQLAGTGARANSDPSGPPDSDWGSNWAGGEASALLADYDWMYDDGPGSPNLDCTTRQPSGCWAHRDNILADYGPDPSMGAAATSVAGVTSMTEVFSSAPAGQIGFAMPEVRQRAEGARVTSKARLGYVQTTRDGAALAYGASGLFASRAPHHLAGPVVGVQVTPGGAGYWEVAADGGVFSFGKAKFYGSAAALHLRDGVVGMATAESGRGYWLATDQGGVYSFGDARFYGTPGGHAGGSVVGIVAVPGGKGYWLTTSHGAVYSFGNAKFFGPHERLHLSSPVVGMAATHDGRGYWLATRDGAVYAFGDAKSHGLANRLGSSRVVGIASSPAGNGYYLALANGRVMPFGGATLAAGRKGGRLAQVVAISAS
jgi:hypothetical protein